ncbi:hypothetical protein BBI01_03645 [Chryseobacterium artocarpi]|uniref:Uncharacterized protein n=1 Tax=Chryseobacterium artocarpi TaxID=1414727 RepID=A0A1B9A155_9FLAO|nr:hypothetical protein [Chryseobacterium artocarpi]OCA77553.1 hypothetical protein BBI01_03645 [Chryseobacterium artocarpi]
MSNPELILWHNDALPVLPKKVSKIEEMVEYGLQLQTKDKKQIISAFNSEAYEMVSTYIWIKAITSLKNQLSKMGLSFIAEMLDRPDINEYSDIQQAISEFEAIRLAEELGVISGTSAFRLRQAMETVTHFNQQDLDDDYEDEMTSDEAKTIVRSCIQGVLGYNKIEAAIDFQNFRTELEEQTLNNDNPYITKLVQSPYFFHRTVIRILLSIIKSSVGAQLENSLSNANLIVPLIWSSLKHPERWQIGRAYSELFTDGQTKAASGLKKVLLRVKGFDFVPEDLRSSSFIKAANEILIAHEGMNNFYNEHKPVNTLYSMGSVIPSPALSVSICAVLCVRLGNGYGVSREAQSSASHILKNLTDDRWIYYLDQCLSVDDRILNKLTQNNPLDRWLNNVFPPGLISRILPQIQDRDVLNLLKFTSAKNKEKIKTLAGKMFKKIGYANK